MDETSVGSSSLTIVGYQLCEEIGRGGMGVVYRARDLGFERDVAIKVLGAKVGADSFAAARFRNEARITGQLQHPGIPAAHELGTLADGKPFLAMKLVKGATLQAMLDQRSSHVEDRGKFVAIFEQICQAVGYAHAHHVIHRDLKPSNVMVGKFGEVQIMDWGLAKVLGEGASESAATEGEAGATAEFVSAIETPAGAGADSGTRTGSVLGTPAYMSPEQAGGEIRRLDARSDVFSLGAMLCEILTGQPPYRGQSGNEVRLKAVRGELAEALAALDGCGAEGELVSLAKQCLSLYQLQRPDDGQSVAKEVGLIRTEAERRARQAEIERSEALVREAEGAARRRQLLIAGSVIGLVLVLGIGGTGIGLYQAQASAQAERVAKEKAQNSEKAERKAKEEAKKKQQEATQRQKEAERERARAEDREAEAIEAVKRFGDVVSANAELRNSDSLKGLRNELLKEPLAYFKSLRERLQADKSTELNSLVRLGNVGFDLGRLTNEIGDKQDAFRAYEESLVIRERLAQEHPHVPKYQFDLASSHHNLGALLREIGKREQAQAACERAIEIRERLTHDYPSEPVYQNALARSYANLGAMLSETRQLAAALSANERAKVIFEELVRKNPTAREYQRSLVRCYQNLGMLLEADGKPDEAFAIYEQERGILERLASANPSLSESQNDLVAIHLLIGRFHRSKKKLPEAIAAFNQAKEMQKRLVSEYPTVTKLQADLADNHTNIGILYNDQGRFPEAVTEYKQATAIKERLVRDNSLSVEFRSSLASTLTNLGLVLFEMGESLDALKSWQQAKAIQEHLAQEQPSVAGFQSALGATLNNLAKIHLAERRYAEACDQLREAIRRQKNALASVPRHPMYRQFLKNHLRNLTKAAIGLNAPEIAQEASVGLKELAASDPQFKAIDERLAAIIKGERPSGVPELLALANRTYELQNFVLATQFYEDAFDQDSKVSENRLQQLGYNAACSALLASEGRGEVIAPLDEAMKLRFRGRALSWLKNEVGEWQKKIENETAAGELAFAVKSLRYWQEDPDLASIREKEKLATLPEAERKEWEAFWGKVKEMLEKAQATLKAQ